MSVQFEYEITPQTFQAAQNLYLAATKRRRLANSIICVFIGLLTLVASQIQQQGSEKVEVYGVLGVVWMVAGLAMFLSGSILRTRYKSSGVAGKRYTAMVDDDGFEVTGGGRRWKAAWRDVKAKAEDEQVIMFYAMPTVFAFGKQFLTSMQQEEVRKLAGMPQVAWTSSSA